MRKVLTYSEVPEKLSAARKEAFGDSYMYMSPCTMQLGNLNTDSKNSMQNKDLIHLKYGALGIEFEMINT